MLEPQLDYAGYLLPISATTPAATLFAKIRKGLFRYSMAYKYVSISLQLKYHLNIGIFSGEYVNDNTLSVYMKRLREKIEENPQSPRLLHTIRGIGYRMEERTE